MEGAYCLHFVSVYIFLTLTSYHILYALCIQRKSLKKNKKITESKVFLKGFFQVDMHSRAMVFCIRGLLLTSLAVHC